MARSGVRRVATAAALIACLVNMAQAQSATASATATAKVQRPDSSILGEFRDDYNIGYQITPTLWTQLPRAKYHIVAWYPEKQYLIAQNDSSNRSDPLKWTRIDWVTLPGMAPWTWGFCLTAYNAPTREIAETVSVAKRDTPKTGCNGFPFSRMKRP